MVGQRRGRLPGSIPGRNQSTIQIPQPRKNIPGGRLTVNARLKNRIFAGVAGVEGRQLFRVR